MQMTNVKFVINSNGIFSLLHAYYSENKFFVVKKKKCVVEQIYRILTKEKKNKFTSTLLCFLSSSLVQQNRYNEIIQSSV